MAEASGGTEVRRPRKLFRSLLVRTNPGAVLVTCIAGLAAQHSRGPPEMMVVGHHKLDVVLETEADVLSQP